MNAAIAGADSAAQRRAPEQRELERLSRLLDSAIPLPGGFRIGLDGLVGLIPGIGDAAGALVSLYIVGRAAALGLPKAVLLRMLMNVGIDSVVGAVPVLGDVFDLAFKANQRNVALVQRYAADARREQRLSILALAGAGIVIVLVIASVIFALGSLFKAVSIFGNGAA